MRHKGVINYWYGKSGQGFIKCPTIKRDVWIHYSTAPNGTRYHKGMEIEFDMVASARGPQAANVVVLGEGKVQQVPKHLRIQRERDDDYGLEPVAWRTSTDEESLYTSEWHFIDPLFPEHTLCGLIIPKDRVVEGGAYPSNCKKCRGRAQRRQRELHGS
jgi:cold shock CspA family protein